MKRWSVALGLVLSCGGDPEERIETRPASALGQQLFSDPALSTSTTNRFSCATCHALSRPAAGELILPGYPLAGVVERPTFWGGQIDHLLEAINACSRAFMQQSTPWNGQEPQAQALFAYLASLPPEVPDALPLSLVPSIQDLPAGDPVRGESVYQRACAYCHGRIHDGEGRLDSSFPILPDEPVASFRDLYQFPLDQTRISFIEKVRHGPFLGLYGRMPPYSVEVLSDDELGALVAYLGLYP